MKEKDTIIAKIKENKKEKISEANIDGDNNDKKGNLVVIISIFVLIAILFIYKIFN